MKIVSVALLLLSILVAPAAAQLLCPNNPPLRAEKGSLTDPTKALTAAEFDEWLSNVRYVCQTGTTLDGRYLLVAGVDGGQSAIGGTATTDGLSFFANSADGRSGARFELFGTADPSTPGTARLTSPNGALTVSVNNSASSIGYSLSSFTTHSASFTADSSGAHILTTNLGADLNGSPLLSQALGDARYSLLGHTHVLADITDAGTAAAKNAPASGNASSIEVVLGSDTRLIDSRAPNGSAGGVLSGTYPNPGFASTTGSGAVVQAGAPTVTNVTVNQAANGDKALSGARSTDTTPTGDFYYFTSHDGLTTLWEVDVTGTLLNGIVPVARVTGLAAVATSGAKADVGLGSVTNDAQTKASVVPNTAPSAGQVLVGNAGGTAYAPAGVSGDATLGSTGALTVTKTNGVSFAASATVDATNGNNIGSGTVALARLPTDWPLSTQTVTGAGTASKCARFDATHHLIEATGDCPAGDTSGSPGGSTGQLQYNNAGAFGGVANSSVDGSGNITMTGSLSNMNYVRVGSSSTQIAAFNRGTDPEGASNMAAAIKTGAPVCWTDNASSESGFVSCLRSSLAGTVAQTGGHFASNLDALTSTRILRNSTTNATQTELFLNGSTLRMTLSNNSAWKIDCSVVARRTDATGGAAAYELEGLFTRDANAASTSIVGSLVGISGSTTIAETDAAWDATLVADTTNGSVDVKVTGEAGKTIRWVAFCRTVEVTN